MARWGVSAGRDVTLIVVDAVGAVQGSLGPYAVALPYWQEVSDIVVGARERYGIEVTVLRLLEAERSVPHGGALTYLAEATSPNAALVPVDVPGLPDHPLRADYARPGGPAASLAWAASVGGAPETVEQQRTWNLSAIWRLTAADGVRWLKQVPPMFAHESTVLRWLGERAPGFVPELLAEGQAPRSTRMLLADVPGDDAYDATADQLEVVAQRWHQVQVESAEAVAMLVAAGVPDGRPLALRTRIAALLNGAAGLGSDLDRRLAALDACGIPMVLVHGDFHPGNVRADGSQHVVLDWGDSFVGHPGFDILRLTDGLADPDGDRLCRAWEARWQASIPGSDPGRALDILRPLAALRNAAVYAGFLERIEPSEHPFHAADVPYWLAEAARLDPTLAFIAHSAASHRTH